MQPTTASAACEWQQVTSPVLSITAKSARTGMVATVAANDMQQSSYFLLNWRKLFACRLRSFCIPVVAIRRLSKLSK
jgi:hypothetical protein